MPSLALTLIPQNVSKENSTNLMATILYGVPTIALREVAAPIGYIGGMTGLGNATEIRKL